MSQPTPEQLQTLMAYASKQLGMTPEQLQKTVQTTDVNRLAGDPNIAKLLQSPQAQALIKQFLGGK